MSGGADMLSLENIRKHLLKLLEGLFRHVLQETEGIETTAFYDFSAEMREFEKYVSELDSIPASQREAEMELEFESKYARDLELAYKLSIESAFGVESASGPALGNESASGFESASESASGFESATRYVSEFGCKPASQREAEMELEFDSKYAHDLELAYKLSVESAFGVESPLEVESASGYESAFASASGYKSASGPATRSESASGSAAGFKSALGFESTPGPSMPGPSTSRYSSPERNEFDFSEIFSSYDTTLGLSIDRILTKVAGQDIDDFYHIIKEKIQVRESLKIFLKRLADKFLGKTPQQEFYFFAIISRIFALLYKEDAMDPKIFMEEVADVILTRQEEFHLFSSIPDELFLNILNDCNDWNLAFQDITCGKASEYFSS